MKTSIQKAQELISRDARLSGFEVRAEGNELHLEKGGDSFVRLIPAEGEGGWRIEVFRPAEEWEIIDYTGSIEDCLALLVEHPPYRFWER